MREWTRQALRELLDGWWAGEWGNDPAATGEPAVVYRSTDIDDDGHLLEDGGVYRSLSPSKLRMKKLVPGDVLLEASGGAPERPVGRTALFKGTRNEPAVAANFLRTLRPKKGVSSEYLNWALLHLYQQPAIWRYQQQTTGMSNLKVSDYLRHELQVPKSEEQSTIAMILNAVTETIDQTEALIAKMQRVKVGMMHDLFTRGVTVDGEFRAARDVAPQLYKESPLGWIPKAWTCKPLQECVSSDITYGIVQAGPHIEGGIPYIRTGDMQRDYLERETLLCTSASIAHAYKRSEVRVGDIVCAIRATIGKVLTVPPDLDGANLTQGTARIAPSSNVNPRYLLWAMRSPVVQKAIEFRTKGTTFVEITLSDLRTVPVPVPDQADEQYRLAVVLDRCDNALESERASLHKLIMLKFGLMHDLITGHHPVST
jgi:type I restriction enzyme, S subunit